MADHFVYRVKVATRLNLRRRPSRSSPVITTLFDGQLVAVLREITHSSWRFVFADTPGVGGFVGYVNRDFLVPVPDADLQVGPLPQLGDDPDHDRDPIREEAPDVPSLKPPLVDGWNPLVPKARRYAGRHGSRRGNVSINRVVIHIAGTSDLKKAQRAYTGTTGGSAHYLIEQNGDVHQFVSENDRAFHSGIRNEIKALYDRNDGGWRQYKRYFQWSSYPQGSVYLNKDMQVLQTEAERSSARLVKAAGGRNWPDYAYFDNQWGRNAGPLGYSYNNRDPNNRSIGIEVLSIGSKSPGPPHYSDAMYEQLKLLVEDICNRHSIPMTREWVCGHEDVTPVDRWGWDPNSGFEWGRILPRLSAGAV